MLRLSAILLLALVGLTLAPSALGEPEPATSSVGAVGLPTCAVGYGVPRVFAYCSIRVIAEYRIVDVDSGRILAAASPLFLPDCAIGYGIPRTFAECWYSGQSKPLIDVDTGNV